MTKDIKIIFEKIKNKYGKVASWAVWKSPDRKNLVSNMEVEGLFDLNKNPQVLGLLQNNVVMVGSNPSKQLNNPPLFHNFHNYDGADLSEMTLFNASKIRYAFTGTSYYGAYMTDIIKNHVESKSEKVKPLDIDSDFETFRDELKILQADKPTIIAFGVDAYKLLKKHLKPNEYSKLIKVAHYAHFGDGCRTAEGYRNKILKQISEGL